MWETLLLLVAAFAAGMLNAAAGGGSFLTLPALVYVGLPPPVANASGTLALLPGYFSGAWAFREDLREVSASQLRIFCLLGVAGGIAGAALLLITPAEAFRMAVPWLLLAATLVFMLAPKLVRKPHQRSSSASPVVQYLGLALVSIYGGYFNGGIGIMLLALLGMSGALQLNTMNGLKNLLSGVLTTVSVVVYMLGDLIAWREAGIMLVAATFGGYVGGRVARRIPAPVLRGAVIVIGLLMTAVMFQSG